MAEEVGSSFPFPPPHWRDGGSGSGTTAGSIAPPPIPTGDELVKCLGDEFRVLDDFPLPSLSALGHKTLVAPASSTATAGKGGGARSGNAMGEGEARTAKAGGASAATAGAATAKGEGKERDTEVTAAALAKSVKELNAQVRASYTSLLDEIRKDPSSPAALALLGEMDNALVNMAHTISRLRPFEARAALAARLRREIAERKAAAVALREAVAGVGV